MPPILSSEKCIGCGTCAQICPLDVFGPHVQGEIPEVCYPQDCWHCMACVMDCPVQAIDLRYPLPLMMLHQKAPQK